ncbi:MAG: hypothetical protein WCQ32_02635 [bacterium]
MATKSKDSVRVKITLAAKGNGMLQNPMTDELLDQLIGVSAKSATQKDIPLSEIAARKVLKSEEGKPGIKIEYLTACLAEAGRSVKIGKKQISTAESTSIFGFLDFLGATFLPFKEGTEDYVVDKRRGVLKNGGKAVAVGIVRPLFKSWEIDLEIEINTTAEFGCQADIVKQLFDAAGTKVGLGDYRPAKKGPFGMFKVAKWEIFEE